MNKTQRQKKAYNNLNREKSCWSHLNSNLKELKKEFLLNIENHFLDWNVFYNQFKNKQLNIVRRLKFKNNKHKSLEIWISVLSLLKNFDDAKLDKDISLQEYNVKDYMLKVLNKMKEIYILKKQNNKKLNKSILSDYRNNNYNRLMLKINQSIKCSNKYLNNLN